jgi:hypothetical protein
MRRGYDTKEYDKSEALRVNSQCLGFFVNQENKFKKVVAPTCPFNVTYLE